MLRLYYASLQNNELKQKFFNEVMQKCRVNYPTVRCWVAKPGSSAHRTPKPLYRGVLAEITGIKEEKLFKS